MLNSHILIMAANKYRQITSQFLRAGRHAINHKLQNQLWKQVIDLDKVGEEQFITIRGLGVERMHSRLVKRLGFSAN